MIPRLALVAAALVLSACGTPAIVTQHVEIPIPVRPITAADLPAPPVSGFAATAPTDPLDVQLHALLLDRETVAAYVIRLRALVGACVGPASPAPRLPTVE